MNTLLGRRSKELDDLLYDEAFWSGIRKTIMGVVSPILRDAFMEGAELATNATPRRQKAELNFDLEAVNIAADDILGTYQNEFWTRINRTQRDALRQAIRRAAQEGLGPDAVIRDIEPLFGLERARMWAVTETTNMIGEGARATYQAAGMRGWEWRTVGDSRVDPICEGKSGEQYPITTPFQAAHVGCVTGDTQVAGPRLIAGTRRAYEGPGLLLVAAGGYELTVTPNHPILTTTGWLPAGELKEGCYVLAQIDERLPALIGPDDVKTPSSIEEVVRSLIGSPRMILRRMPTAAEYFHGDGSAYGEVEIIGPNSSLRRDFQPSGLQLRQHDDLQRPSHREQALPAGRIPGALLDAPPAAGGRDVGLGRLLQAPSAVHLSPFQGFGLRLTSGNDSSLSEPLSDHEPGNLKSLGQRIFRDSLSIKLDDQRVVDRLAVVSRPVRLLEVRPKWISGHVYNLETEEGWFAAAGLIVANCRCWPDPVLA